MVYGAYIYIMNLYGYMVQLLRIYIMKKQYPWGPSLCVKLNLLWNINILAIY